LESEREKESKSEERNSDEKDAETSAAFPTTPTTHKPNTTVSATLSPIKVTPRDNGLDEPEAPWAEIFKDFGHPKEDNSQAVPESTLRLTWDDPFWVGKGSLPIAKDLAEWITATDSHSHFTYIDLGSHLKGCRANSLIPNLDSILAPLQLQDMGCAPMSILHELLRKELITATGIRSLAVALDLPENKNDKKLFSSKDSKEASEIFGILSEFFGLNDRKKLTNLTINSYDITTSTTTPDSQTYSQAWRKSSKNKRLNIHHINLIYIAGNNPHYIIATHPKLDTPISSANLNFDITQASNSTKLTRRTRESGPSHQNTNRYSNCLGSRKENEISKPSTPSGSPNGRGPKKQRS
jgi:hypothetical protein